MTDRDIKPGNPLRVRCRTCGTAAGTACSWGNNQSHPEFHKKRVRDARQDYIANSPPRIVEAGKQSISERRWRGHMRAESWRRARRDMWARAAAIATVGEVPGVERALNDVARKVSDLNTPAFWKSVWADDKETP